MADKMSTVSLGRKEDSSNSLITSPRRLLGLACIGLMLAVLPGCGKKSAQTDVGADQSAAADNGGAGTLESAPMPPECVEEGKAAARFAQERDRGTSLDQVVLEINQSKLPQEQQEAEANIARQLYHDSFASKLSPDNANNNFSMACLADKQRENTGNENITAKADIDKALSLFRTFNGSPLGDLLGQYGVTIQSLQIAQVKTPNNNGYKSGDVVYTLSIGGDGKGLPCNLQRWVRGDIPPTPEFIQRGPAFPLIRPTEDDPLIYWAATGKCSATSF